jgi:hypothetical protein
LRFDGSVGTGTAKAEENREGLGWIEEARDEEYGLIAQVGPTRTESEAWNHAAAIARKAHSDSWGIGERPMIPRRAGASRRSTAAMSSGPGA